MSSSDRIVRCRNPFDGGRVVLVETVPYRRTAMGGRTRWDERAGILDISVLLTLRWHGFTLYLSWPSELLLRDTVRRGVGFPLISRTIWSKGRVICTSFSHFFQPTVWRVFFIPVAEVVILVISNSCSRLPRHDRSVELFILSMM